jgi:hypothetical protein
VSWRGQRFVTELISRTGPCCAVAGAGVASSTGEVSHNCTRLIERPAQHNRRLASGDGENPPRRPRSGRSRKGHLDVRAALATVALLDRPARLPDARVRPRRLAARPGETLSAMTARLLRALPLAVAVVVVAYALISATGTFGVVLIAVVLVLAGALALWARRADASGWSAMDRTATGALLCAPGVLVVYFSFSSGGFFPESVALATSQSACCCCSGSESAGGRSRRSVVRR